MPLIIDENTIQNTKNTLSVKDFFHSDLTGDGRGDRGLFSKGRNTLDRMNTVWDTLIWGRGRCGIQHPETEIKEKDFLKNITDRGDHWTTRRLSLNLFPLPVRVLKKHLEVINLPDVQVWNTERWKVIGDTPEARIKMAVIPRVIRTANYQKKEFQNGSPVTVRDKGFIMDFTVAFEIERFDETGEEIWFQGAMVPSGHAGKSVFVFENEQDEMLMWKFINTNARISNPAHQMQIKKRIRNAFKEGKVREFIDDVSTAQQEDFDADVMTYAEWLVEAVKNAFPGNTKYQTEIVSDWVLMLDSCSGYARKNLLSSGLLSDLAVFFENAGLEKERIIAKSLRLLLADRLLDLEKKNQQGLLEAIPQDSQVIQDFHQSGDFSVAQKAIITNPNSLIIGTAGAGAGKSHTVTGRLKFFEENGIDMSSVAVFSFTNVAADNIRSRFPGISSETLAKMFHSIFEENFEDIELAPSATIANALRLMDGTEPSMNKPDISEKGTWARLSFASKLAAVVEKFDQKGFERTNLAEAFRDLSALTAEELTLTCEILRDLEMVSLEIEPVILHHFFCGGVHLSMPAKYDKIRHIITDESQDISTFEYIILLEMVCQKKTSFLIVGDGAQTLYEFRNSDPKYLNALEKSHVFENKTLNTNFRSNQEILMVANKFLEIIEANDTAKIQLKSSNWTKVSQASLEEHVKLCEVKAGPKNNEFAHALEVQVPRMSEVRHMILNSLKKGEQVALLAWTREEAHRLQDAALSIAKDGGYDPNICSLIKDREQKDLKISEALSMTSIDVGTLINPGAVILKVCNALVSARTRYVGNIQKASAIRISMENDIKNGLAGDARWNKKLSDYATGNISKENFEYETKKALFRIEAEKNKVNEWLAGASRQDVDPKDFDIVVSTIHSAKGLEFDNVILAYNAGKSGAKTQEALRLFFVGLTRAKNSEIILSNYSDPTTCNSWGINPMLTAFEYSKEEANGRYQCSFDEHQEEDDD